jgi:hypothetical protein
MTQPQSTTILIRVQARGGKFLGPNAKPTEISVLDGGNVIFGPVLTSGDSGTTDPNTGAPFPPTASRDVIAVAPTDGGPPAGAYWLTPDDSTAGVVATFILDCPSLLEFRATTTNGITTSTMMWVVPGMQLTTEPGLLLSVPGLLVSVSATVGAQIDVTATVTMMCGCPITTPTWPQNGPEPYWPEPEFQVFATLESVTQQMTFSTTNTFTTSFPVPETSGSTITVYALQQAESNVGYATVTL